MCRVHRQRPPVREERQDAARLRVQGQVAQHSRTCFNFKVCYKNPPTLNCDVGLLARTISVWDVQRLLTRDRENETTGEGERAVRNNNGSRINILNRAHDGWIWDFTVNSSNLLSCSWDRSAKAWDFNTWQTTGEFKYERAIIVLFSFF